MPSAPLQLVWVKDVSKRDFEANFHKYKNGDLPWPEMLCSGGQHVIQAMLLLAVEFPDINFYKTTLATIICTPSEVVMTKIAKYMNDLRKFKVTTLDMFRAMVSLARVSRRDRRVISSVEVTVLMVVFVLLT